MITVTGSRGLELGRGGLLDDPFLVDALVWCDMATTPDGLDTTAAERIAEILARYGPGSVVGRFIRRAAPDIHAAVQRVETVLAGQLRGG